MSVRKRKRARAVAIAGHKEGVEYKLIAGAVILGIIIVLEAIRASVAFL